MQPMADELVAQAKPSVEPEKIPLQFATGF
jgi:hypothetical protein